MKCVYAIITIWFSFVITAFSQDRAELHLDKAKLSGLCDHRYFTGFAIELDSNYAIIDSAMLFDQLPRIGSIKFKNRVDIPTEFTLTNRSGRPQIMFRFRTNYLTFDSLEIRPDLITFTVDDDPEVPVIDTDLQIVRLSKELLSEEKYWNNTDDRNCTDDLANKSYSIYCAIRIASLEIENKYNHRNAVLQKLRHLIEEEYPNKRWKHRLMDFNNMEDTTYSDIMKILDDIELDFISEMDSFK